MERRILWKITCRWFFIERTNLTRNKRFVYLENETLIFERSLNPGRATINETFRCMPVREGHLSCEKKKEGRKDRWTCKKHLKNLCTWRCKRTGSVRLRDLRTWKMDTLTRQGGGGKGRATRVYREETKHRESKRRNLEIKEGKKIVIYISRWYKLSKIQRFVEMEDE